MSVHPVPRLISSLTALALTGALFAVAAPAQADVTGGSLESEIDIDVYDAASDLRRAAGCVSSTGGDGTDEDVSDDGVVQNQELDVTSTITEEGEIDRTARASTSAASRLTSTGGSWSTFDFAASIDGQVDPAAAKSGCTVRLQGAVFEDFQFDVAEDGWVDLAWDFASEGEAYADLEVGQRKPRRGGVEYYGRYVSGGSVSESTTFFMEAGEYSLWVNVNGSVREEQQVTRGTGARAEEALAYEASLNVAASFTPAGQARTALQGSGRRYVTIPGAVDCETNSIAPSMKANAKKLQFAKFYLNGALARVVKKPSKNQTVALAGVDPASHATVKVLVKTKKIVKKKKKNGKVIRKVIKPKKYTATRSFLGCQ